MSRAGRRIAISLLLLGVVAIVAAAATYVVQTDYFGKKVKIAMVVKSSGSGFFEAAHLGANEAAKELGDVELIFKGPDKATAQGQIEIIDSLLNHGLFEKKVDAIVVSANDRDALVPVAQKAMASGVKVLSFDSGIAKEGRVFHLLPSSTELIGEKLVKMTAEAIGNEGQVAILSATAQATNQNAWIEAAKKVFERPEYQGMKLVWVAYGDDQADKSYKEALILLQRFPNLKAIIAPTTVGIVAAAKAVKDVNFVGRVHVTGLGLPSEMAPHVKNGTVKSFAIWNPIDLGYSITYAAHEYARGNVGKAVSLGRVGQVTPDGDNSAPMAEPFTFNADNVEKFAKYF